MFDCSSLCLQVKQFFKFLYETLKLKQLIQPPIIASVSSIILGWIHICSFIDLRALSYKCYTEINYIMNHLSPLSCGFLVRKLPFRLFCQLMLCHVLEKALYFILGNAFSRDFKEYKRYYDLI